MTQHSPAEIQFLSIIETYGWHVANVQAPADGSGFSFAYSTGLWKTHKHPEIVITGLEPSHMHEIINRVGARARDTDETLEPDKHYSGLIEDLEVFTIAVPTKQVKRFATMTDWFYERGAVPMLQLAWPSIKGTWPWEPSTIEGFHKKQPILNDRFIPPVAKK